MNPTSPSTLCELLSEAAASRKGGISFHLGEEPVVFQVEELYERALERASQLGCAGVGRGEMVGLLGPNFPEWVEWAWGTWLAGCVLVPLPAPLRVRDPALFSSQVASLAGAMACSVIVGDSRYLELLDDGCPRLDWSSEPGPAPISQPARVAPRDLAMVLCTSGSTAAPKGVRMTHARAMVWARINTATGVPGSVPAIVSWLPFYHIGGMGPLFEVVAPVDWHVLPMGRFVRDPAQWLRLVARTRARTTVGPSSAWAAALRGLAKAPEGVDLSCLKGAVFNAETVDPRGGRAHRRGVRPARLRTKVGQRSLRLLGGGHDKPHRALRGAPRRRRGPRGAGRVLPGARFEQGQAFEEGRLLRGRLPRCRDLHRIAL